MVGKSSGIGSEMQLIRNQISIAGGLYDQDPEIVITSIPPVKASLNFTKKRAP